MSELKCDICGKIFRRHANDNGDITVCDECRKTMLDELSDGKGEDDE